MTSWKNKLVGAIATGAIVAGLMPVAAFGEGALTKDATISVTGIDSGDTAAYYQVIQQNADTNAWELKAPFTGLGLADLAGNAEVKTEHPTWTDVDYIIQDGISAEEAGVIAAKASGAGTALEEASGTWSATVNPGTYLVLVTPKNDNKDVVYKPIFVSADYDQTTASPNTLAANTAELATAVAKKSPLTLDKTAKQINDGDDEDSRGVAVGDTVEFTVETNVPSYTTNFTNPIFKLTDVLTQGLSLTKDTITVEVAGYTEGTTINKGTDYTVAENDALDGYTINFTKAFLNRVTGNPKLTVKYKATITSDAATQVNEMDNTVKLNFSNTPSDTTGAGELKDKTRHYTFDIDGDVFGGKGQPGGDTDKGRTEEVQKVYIEANGTVKESEKATEYTGTNALQGAVFHLRTVAGDDTSALKFKNGVLSSAADASADITSDEYGSIVMKGLDLGTYYLVEMSAPAGYSFEPNVEHPIVIAAKDWDVDDEGNAILTGYTITIDGKNTSTYTVENAGEDLADTTTMSKVTVDSDSITTLITNKKLGILPSTGGSGIYFYLVLGAAVAGGAGYLLYKTKKQDDLA